jgi:hypothetical protein
VDADLGFELLAQRQQPIEHTALGDIVAPEADWSVSRHADLLDRTGPTLGFCSPKRKQLLAPR